MQLNYRRTGERKRKKSKERMCVVCFLLCQAFGFGKENEDAGETRGNKEKEEEKKESVVGQSYVDSSVISGQIIR